MGFKLDRQNKADEKDLDLSKDTSDLCLKYWRNLQKIKRVFEIFREYWMSYLVCGGEGPGVQITLAIRLMRRYFNLNIFIYSEIHLLIFCFAGKISG